MVRYHVSDGVARRCVAKPGNCRLGGAGEVEHYDSLEAANSAIEETNAQDFGDAFSTMPTVDDDDVLTEKLRDIKDTPWGDPVNYWEEDNRNVYIGEFIAESGKTDNAMSESELAESMRGAIDQFKGEGFLPRNLKCHVSVRDRGDVFRDPVMSAEVAYTVPSYENLVYYRGRDGGVSVGMADEGRMGVIEDALFSVCEGHTYSVEGTGGDDSNFSLCDSNVRLVTPYEMALREQADNSTRFERLYRVTDDRLFAEGMSRFYGDAVSAREFADGELAKIASDEGHELTRAFRVKQRSDREVFVRGVEDDEVRGLVDRACGGVSGAGVLSVGDVSGLERQARLELKRLERRDAMVSFVAVS